MPIDASIYSAFAPKVRSPEDVQNALSQTAQNALSMQHAQMQMRQLQSDMADSEALKAAYRSGADPTTPEGRAAIIKAAPLQAPKILQAGAEYDKTKAQTTEASAKADKAKADAKKSGLESLALTTAQLAQGMRAIDPNDDQGIVNLYHKAITSGAMTPEDAQAELQRVPPAGTPERAAWHQRQVEQGITLAQKMQNALEIQKAAETARYHQDETKTQRDNAALMAKTHLQAAGIAASTSRANNAATIAKDYKVAGLDAQGNFQGGNGALDGLIDGIGQGKVPESTALGRVPPGMKAQVMSEVMKRYPDYDPTNLQTRAAANKAFTSGKEAQLLRSIGTANKHLDMVGGMVDALNNGNVQLFNKAANTVATQLGYEAPTNFDAAKEIVGQEVVKSIVANGGGVKEREEAAAALDKVKSPKQLRGVIQTYKTIMDAQRESLLQQRRAAGLPDSTIPDYTEAPKTPSKVVKFGDLK